MSRVYNFRNTLHKLRLLDCPTLARLYKKLSAAGGVGGITIDQRIFPAHEHAAVGVGRACKYCLSYSCSACFILLLLRSLMYITIHIYYFALFFPSLVFKKI